MANTGTQAEAIRDLLVQKLEEFDPSDDVSVGSSLYTKVVQPVFSALGTDPFDTDIEEFLKTRFRQEYPTIVVDDGAPIVDLLIRPLQLLFEALKREIQQLRLGQSVNYRDQMRLTDAEDLAANFFVTRRSGSRASGSVRLYFTSPTYVSILASVEFSTPAGLVFVPTIPQFFRPETLLLQTSGSFYYVDVGVVALETGDSYNVGEGEISLVSGISSASRVTNLYAVGGGSNEETATELLTRTETSLTERSLNTRRGMVARILTDFPSIRTASVVGYGDPEMKRDVVTGGGHGRTIASGMSFVVSQFVIMFSMYEDRGEAGTDRVAVGDKIDLNYWKFLYDVEPENAHEIFTIDEVVFDSRDDITNLPTILILRIDGSPTKTLAPISGALPGILPGVFSVITTEGAITISDIPGGITKADRGDGTIAIVDNEIHIGGHYDVWLRPTDIGTSTTTLDGFRSEDAIVSGLDLATNGGIAGILKPDVYSNKVHRKYSIHHTMLVGGLALGDIVEEFSGGVSTTSRAMIKDIDATGEITFVNLTGEFTAGNTLRVGTAEASIDSVNSYNWVSELGVESGDILNILSGNEEGLYKILKIEGVFLYLDLDLTTTSIDNRFRVVRTPTVDMFSPKSVLYPYMGASSASLSTVVGADRVVVSEDIKTFGVQAGDSFEILEGEDIGVYTISGFDEVLGGLAPILSSTMTSTNSSVLFRVYRSGSGMLAPMLRIVPGEVNALDSSGNTTGYTVPYSLPVGARAYQGFSGARASYYGKNGFVLPDPGPTWLPSADVVVDPTTTALLDPDACFSGDCETCTDGYIAVISVTEAGSLYVNVDLPAAVSTFMTDLRSWLVDVVGSFRLGDDLQAFIDGFHPFYLGDPAILAPTDPIVKQVEICLPKSIFDGCNNVYVAMPEFDWAAEFEGQTFSDAMDMFNNGEMRGARAGLCYSNPGDSLTILSGRNAGSYIIDRVDKYNLLHGGTLQGIGSGGPVTVDETLAYEIAVITIKGEFPVEPFKDLSSFFASTPPSMTLPAPPPFNVRSYEVPTGTPISPWEVVKRSFTWFFQWLASVGFDVPADPELNDEGVLKSIWESLLTDYTVGSPTCEQVVRMNFIEPTSVSVFGNRPCEYYTWNETLHTPATATSDPFTLPLDDLVGTVAELTVVHPTTGAETTLSATLSDVAYNTVATPAALAAMLQHDLDEFSETVIISSSDITTKTGTLTVKSRVAVGGTSLSIKAAEKGDAFRNLGFWDDEGGKWVEVDSSGTATDMRVRVTDTAQISLTWDMTNTLFRVEGTLGAGDLGPGLPLGTKVEWDGGASNGFVWGFYTDVATGYYLLLLRDCIGTTPAPGVDTMTTVGGASMSLTYAGAGANKFGVHALYAASDELLESFGAGVADAVEAAARLAFQTAIDPFAVVRNLGTTSTDTVEVPIDVAMTLTDADADGLGDDFRFTLYLIDTGTATKSPLLTVPTLAAPGDVEPDGGETDFVATYMMSPSVVGAIGTYLSDDSLEWVGGDYGRAMYLLAAATMKLPALNTGTYRKEWALAEGVTVNTEVIEKINDDDFDGAAIYLNANARSGTDEDGDALDRTVWWVGGTGLSLRTVLGAATTDSLALDTSTDPGSKFSYLGFVEGVLWEYGPSSSTVAYAFDSVGEEVPSFYHPPPATLFSAAAGTAELLYAATASDGDYNLVPAETSTGVVAATSLPRDLLIRPHYTSATSAMAYLTATDGPSLMSAGVQKGSDYLNIHEQRKFLEFTTTIVEPKEDRVIAVTGEVGSTALYLPELSDHDFTFPASETTLERDAVQPGDLLFIEEGDNKGGYTVMSVAENYVTIDRALLASTGVIYKLNNDGSPQEGTKDFVATSAPFTSDDIGRFLTIWASNYEGVDGSYRITAVDALGTTLTLGEMDADFLVAESFVHWAIVRAPVDDPADSGIAGGTELVGMIPVRIYNGASTAWRVGHVDAKLSRVDAHMDIVYGDSTTGPFRGHLQPYRITRPGVRHIPSTTMKTQGRETGFYYFDVLAESLGGDKLFNIPGETRMEPVFGTYRSDGYRFTTADDRFVYSSREATKLLLSTSFLPNSLNDAEENKLILESRGLRMSYEYSPAVTSIQALLDSDTDRILCADALARHYLPSYVYLDISMSGGNSTKMAEAIKDFIKDLGEESPLDLSQLEKFLHDNGVTRYDHPIIMAIVTHDLDRRLVLTRSSNQISDASIDFNGTNRTTYYIPGPMYTSEEAETDIKDGERLYLTGGS